MIAKVVLETVSLGVARDSRGVSGLQSSNYPSGILLVNKIPDWARECLAIG